MDAGLGGEQVTAACQRSRRTELERAHDIAAMCDPTGQEHRLTSGDREHLGQQLGPAFDAEHVPARLHPLSDQSIRPVEQRLARGGLAPI